MRTGGEFENSGLFQLFEQRLLQLVDELSAGHRFVFVGRDREGKTKYLPSRDLPLPGVMFRDLLRFRHPRIVNDYDRRAELGGAERQGKEGCQDKAAVSYSHSKEVPPSCRHKQIAPLRAVRTGLYRGRNRA